MTIFGLLCDIPSPGSHGHVLTCTNWFRAKVIADTHFSALTESPHHDKLQAQEDVDDDDEVAVVVVVDDVGGGEGSALV